MFTRYIESIPIRNANAITIKLMLTKHIFLRYGSPDVILSDNGSTFKTEEQEKYYEKTPSRQCMSHRIIHKPILWKE